MTDITIPADVAKQIANVLRGIRIAYPERCDEWADLLDQPAPSLRDEVAEIVRIKNSGHSNAFYDARADAVLAVVRRHVAALPVWGGVGGDPDWLVRDDVLRLLGAGE